MRRKPPNARTHFAADNTYLHIRHVASEKPNRKTYATRLEFILDQKGLMEYQCRLYVRPSVRLSSL